MLILPGQGKGAHVDSGERQHGPPRRPSARRLRSEARTYLVYAVLGLVLAAPNLIGGSLDGIDLLLGGAGLLIAAAGFVLWRKRRREARLAGE